MHQNSTPPHRRCQSTHQGWLYLPRLHPGRVYLRYATSKENQFNKCTRGKTKQGVFFPKGAVILFCVTWGVEVGFWRPIWNCKVANDLCHNRCQWEKPPKNMMSLLIAQLKGVCLFLSCITWCKTKLSQSCHDKYFCVRCTCAKMTKIGIWQQLHHDYRYYEELVGDLCNVPSSTSFPEVPGNRKENPNGECLCSTGITLHIQNDWALNHPKSLPFSLHPFPKSGSQIDWM